MQQQFVVCQACGNLYLLVGTRHYCPVCSGEPLSLEGVLAVVKPEPEAAPEVEESEEELPPGGEEPAEEDQVEEEPAEEEVEASW